MSDVKNLNLNLAQTQKHILADVCSPDKRNDRLEIYRYAFISRLTESLQVDFSETRKLLGTKFDDFVLDFVLKTPSRSQDMAEFSSLFPSYLQRSLPEDQKWISSLAQKEYLEILSWITWTPADFSFSPSMESQLKIRDCVYLYKGIYEIENSRCFVIYSDAHKIHSDPISEADYNFLFQLKSWQDLSSIEFLMRDDLNSNVLTAKLPVWISLGFFDWKKKEELM